MEFANQPAILYTLALVGICGGLAPAACLALGAKLWRGRSIPLNHLLALVPTAILLLGGMLILAISEWNGLLAHLAWGYHQVGAASVRQALTISLAFMMMLTLSAGSLVATQSIAAKELIFEAVSALCTVGLSMGATSHLDEVGKLIIIATMFCGRVGPLAIFSLVCAQSDEGQRAEYPAEDLPLA